MSWKIIVTYDVQTVQSWNAVVKRQENWKSPQRFGACVGTRVNGFPMSRRWSVQIWSVIWNTLLMTSDLGKWWRCVAKIGIVRRLLLCCYCLFLESHQHWSVDWSVDWSPIMTGQPANLELDSSNAFLCLLCNSCKPPCRRQHTLSVLLPCRSGSQIERTPTPPPQVALKGAKQPERIWTQLHSFFILLFLEITSQSSLWVCAGVDRILVSLQELQQRRWWLANSFIPISLIAENERGYIKAFVFL